MTSKAFRNLSEAELAAVAGGIGMAVIPAVGSQGVGGTRDESTDSGSGAQGGGSNLSELQEQQPEF
jgi:hypothetical protein